jgi:hypothetical protein
MTMPAEIAFSKGSRDKFFKPVATPRSVTSFTALRFHFPP